MRQPQWRVLGGAARGSGCSIIATMRCGASPQLTSGALELAGMVLSLFLAEAYTSAFADGARGCPHNITVYGDDKPIVEFVLLGASTDAGACHFEGLVEIARGRVSKLRQAGHVVEVAWSPRWKAGLRRAHDLAASGRLSDWPDGLLGLLVASSNVFAAARPQDRQVMRRC